MTLDVDFPIRVGLAGNPGNVMMAYLAAVQMQRTLGYGTVYGATIPLFDIACPPFTQGKRAGLHDRLHPNGRNRGKVPFRGLARAVAESDSAFISLEGYCQHVDNFPHPGRFDYQAAFPPLDMTHPYGGEGDIVISIRGGEILTGISSMYVLLPPEFYAHVIRKSGRRPVFFGQLDPSPYLDELRSAFPDAVFLPGRDAAHDFDFLRKARHLVPSISTFAWLAAWMSDAQKIYFPVAGTLNPAHHFYAMLLPFDDPRYEFFLFPVYFGRPVSEYRRYLDPVRRAWSAISGEALAAIHRGRDDALDDALMVVDYRCLGESTGPLRDVWKSWGEKGVVNWLSENWQQPERRLVDIDREFYVGQDPAIGMDLSLGHFATAQDHYLRKGRYLNYRPRA